MSCRLRITTCVATAMIAAARVWASTYYIDYEQGVDTNGGHDKASPWKRHPFMQGFAGSYSHSAGDVFVFKGGVIWPNEALGMIIKVGGDDQAADRYQNDKTWYSGKEWSRPVFDMSRKSIVGDGPIVVTDKASNIVIDGFEIRNQRIDGTARGKAGLAVNGTNAKISLLNCYIHDWWVASPTVTPDHDFGGIYVVGATNSVIDSCIVRGAEVDGFPGKYSGIGLRISSSNSIVRNCEFSFTPNGILGSGEIHDTVVHDIFASYDSGSNVLTPTNGRHANGVYLFGAATFYNNTIRSIVAPGAPVLFPAAGWNGSSSRVDIFNNVIQGNIHLNADGMTATNTATYHIYNNLVIGYNSVVISSKKTDNAIYQVDIANNVFVCIGTYPSPVNFAQPVANLHINNNLYLNTQTSMREYVMQLTGTYFGSNVGMTKLSVSQTRGWNAGSVLAPIGTNTVDLQNRPTSQTIGIGANLSDVDGLPEALRTAKNGVHRPSSGPWDLGPYTASRPAQPSRPEVVGSQ